MDRRPRGRHLLAIAVAVLLCAPVALASPQDVIADWDAEGRIDGDYSIGDLRKAPIVMQAIDPDAVRGLAAAVQVEIDRKVLGITQGGRAPTDADPPRADVPMWATAGAIGAAALLAAGIGSNIILRTRRRT